MKIKKNHKLRKPGGQYISGCTNFIHEYNDGERIIPCLCFYPAQSKGEGNRKKYISEKILSGGGGIETNSYINAPVCDGKHPLLVFNHGFSLGCEANTVQFEELASHGYIILSVGHQEDGSYELPSGEVLLFDMNKKMKDFQKETAAGTELFTKYGNWLTGEGKDATMEEHGDFYQSIIDSQQAMVAQSEVWIKDSLIVLDWFLQESGQENSMFFNHVDQDKIGSFGMSFGGSIALDLTFESALIKACANLDGFFFSSNWQRPLNKPVLLMHHDGIGGYFLTYPFLIAKNDAYLATVKNTTHGNFMDYNELLAENLVSKAIVDGEEVELTMLGEIDPDQMENIMNTMLLDFFNKYLMEKDSQVIDSGNPPDEVTLLRK